MNDLTTQVRIGDESAFVILPIWRTPDGAAFIPRQGETVIRDGKTYLVDKVVWNYDNDSLIAYVSDKVEQAHAIYANAISEMRNQHIYPDPLGAAEVYDQTRNQLRKDSGW